MSEEQGLLTILLSGGLSVIVLGVSYLVTAPVINIVLNQELAYQFTMPLLGPLIVNLMTVYTVFFLMLIVGILFWMFHAVYQREFGSEAY